MYISVKSLVYIEQKKITPPPKKNPKKTRKQNNKTVTCFFREVYLPSGTELIPLFPFLRAGLLKQREDNVGLAQVSGRCNRLWPYRVSLTFFVSSVCEFILVPSNLPANQAVVIQQLSIG